ncbi:MAG: dihydrodipicolinate synthase family protein [Thermoplasmata archaeon]|jgi:dihydrodipicolinate synthase/N-acetylneuraminate lyase
MLWDGLVIPIPTLFAGDGTLDVDLNVRFAVELARAGADRLFVLGSLGEFPSVSDDERARLVRAVVDGLAGRVDVWVGCGAPSTRQAVAFAQGAEGAGAAALLAVPPYYLHPTPAAIDRYYRAIHAATHLPLLAYNIPSLVGYRIAPEFVQNLVRGGVVVGVKDTSGSIESVEQFLRNAPAGMRVLPGDDRLASAAIGRGASGAIMGLANILPKLCVDLVAAAHAGNRPLTCELQGLVDGLADVVAAGPFPATGKFLAHRLRGAEVGYRAPYDPLNPEEEAAVLARLAPCEERFAPYR